jgi:hypothetical protein
MTQLLEPVRQSLEVAAPAAAAFRIWTEDIARWWPLATHSVGQADARGCAIEGRVGGRIYESTQAGAEHVWGTITLWDPPRRLAHSWHPGRTAADATTVEVTFTPLADRRTRLDLEHRGWPAEAAARRAEYDRGWAALLRNDYAPYLRRALLEAGRVATG